MKGVLDIDVAEIEGSGGNDMRVLAAEQADVAAQPHTQDAQLVQHHDLGGVHFAGVHDLQLRNLHNLQGFQWALVLVCIPYLRRIKQGVIHALEC